MHVSNLQQRPYGITSRHGHRMLVRMLFPILIFYVLGLLVCRCLLCPEFNLSWRLAVI